MTSPERPHRGFRALADKWMDHAEAAPVRIPLTTNQHILHLILTIVTCGLWAPVWFVRAWRGNPAPR